MTHSPRRLLLLLVANLLASIGGGRVVSAGRGAANLPLLGGASLLAFLAGSALGLALLLLLRRLSLSRALLLTSVGSLANALVCLSIVSRVPSQSRMPVRLDGGAAWLFFGCLVLLCALWYAGRSLRSTLAAEGSSSWLALSEAAYFAGFICGLLLGPVSLAGQAGVVGALLLDILLLGGVVACDTMLGAALPPREQPAATSVSHLQSSPVSRNPGNLRAVRLMLAFACLGVSCQVTIFHLVDLLAQSSKPQSAAWTDGLLAVFYVGISVAAIAAHWLKPNLQEGGGHPLLCLQLCQQRLRIPLVRVLVLIGGLVFAVLLGAGGDSQGHIASQALCGVLLLAALGSSTAIYELLVLAIVGQVNTLASRAVGISIGVSATAAALALLAFSLGGVDRGGLLITAALGLTLSFALVRSSLSLVKARSVRPQ